MSNLIHIWSRIITFDCAAVIFAHGTAVVVPAGTPDPREAARQILQALPLQGQVGSVINLATLPGWVVTAAALEADMQDLTVLHVERGHTREFARSSSPLPSSPLASSPVNG